MLFGRQIDTNLMLCIDSLNREIYSSIYHIDQYKWIENLLKKKKII